jgi:periplasmic divalent cation tolerance protein
MTDKAVILTTTASEAEASRIAYALVEQKLAACVNIVPRVQSIYRWQGKAEQGEEYLLLIKTSLALQQNVLAAVRSLHSYEVPEFVVLRIESGSEEYLKWMTDSLVSKNDLRGRRPPS